MGITKRLRQVNKRCNSFLSLCSYNSKMYKIVNILNQYTSKVPGTYSKNSQELFYG